MNCSARVFDIQRFSVHDGEGIRTTVFLKGCPLRCPWCSNPESWYYDKSLVYDEKKCIKCRRCEEYCEAIKFVDDKFIYDEKSSNLCEKSVENCPTGALEIKGYDLPIDEIVEIVLKDYNYYKNSNGGVTISGGDPFFQKDDFINLIKELKNAELNITVDTKGNYSNELLKRAEKYIDTFLFDIKSLDKEKLKKINANYDLIMKNFNYLVNSTPDKVVVRVPVIHNFNYNEKDLKDIIVLAKESKVKRIHLLPYHTLGKAKWKQLNREYFDLESKPIKDKELERYVEFGNEIGIETLIGG